MVSKVNYNRGLFAYKKLVLGLASAAGIFQREMEQLLQGLDKVTCVFVIFTSGDSDKDLSDCLDKVFGKLAKVGLTLNMEKCCFSG